LCQSKNIILVILFGILPSSFMCLRICFSRALTAVYRTRNPSRQSLFPRARVSDPTARSHDAGFRSVRDGPPRIAGFLRQMRSTETIAAPLHSEHTSYRRDSAIKLMVAALRRILRRSITRGTTRHVSLPIPLFIQSRMPVDVLSI